MTPQSWHGKLKIAKIREGHQAAKGIFLSLNNFFCI